MKEEEKREVDFREENHVDVRNDFITMEYPEGIKAADLKMIRFVISQCRKGDKEFFEYEFSAADMAKHMHMDKSNLYHDAMDMAEKRLFNCNLRKGTEKQHEIIHLFKKCTYNNGIFTMRMDDEAKELFLELRRNFTEIPIAPILLMRNKNSIRIYELICEKFMSHFPYANKCTSINISLDELLKVTEREAKKSYEQAGHVKERVLTPAIREIEEAADWKIIVTNLKRSRKVTGFNLEVWSRNGWEVMEQCKREGTLPPMPKYRNGADDVFPGQA